MHTRGIEYRNSNLTAYCNHCPWEHRGDHQAIIEAWHQHTEDIGKQQCIPHSPTTK